MVLEKLHSPEISNVAMTIATPKAIRNVLRLKQTVIELRDAIACGNISEREISDSVACLLKELSKGEQFLHEAYLCALAVALESLSSDYAQTFLEDLASVHIVEMPLSPRVARLCLDHRKSLVSNTSIARISMANHATVSACLSNSGKLLPVPETKVHEGSGQPNQNAWSYSSEVA